MKPGLEDVEPTAANHFRLCFQAAVFYLVDHLRRSNGEQALDRSLNQFGFLVPYLEQSSLLIPAGLTWEETGSWWEREILRWEDRAEGVHLPLRSLRLDAGIEFDARMALVIGGMIEEDSRFGELFEFLGSGHPRPTLEMVGQVISRHRSQEASAMRSMSRVLLDGSLLEVPNRSDPRSAWLVRVPTSLWDIVIGSEQPELPHHARWLTPSGLFDLEELALPTHFVKRVLQVGELFTTGQVDAVVIRGMRSAERVEIVGAIAASLGKSVLHVVAEKVPADGWPRLGPLSASLGAIPVFEFDLDPGQTGELRPLAAYSGPIGIVLGDSGGLDGPGVERAVTLEVPLATVECRMRRWASALGDHCGGELPVIAERFRLQTGHIARAASGAIAVAALNGRSVVDQRDVQKATRLLNRQMLDTLASRLDGEGSWDQLVVGAYTDAKLTELEARCRHRERLPEHLGPAFESSSNPGVRALFTGASGTGKTLAARILGAQLGLDVYRVDLAAVVNKYIGETEKNLHRVLSTAEELDVVLLIDEGDALLGSRTEVKTANDRFANLETNYLLQRLEHYSGIVVVTTNAVENVDSAFQRRMDVVVSFVAPPARERREIWEIHLPADSTVDPGHLDTISLRCAFTGGQIRNAALHASLLALSDSCPVETRHLELAIAAEYQKAGTSSPFDPSGRGSNGSRARIFLESLT